MKCELELNLWQQDSIEVEAKVRDFSIVDSESDLVSASQVSARIRFFVDIESQLWQRITTEQIQDPLQAFADLAEMKQNPISLNARVLVESITCAATNRVTQLAKQLQQFYI